MGAYSRLASAVLPTVVYMYGIAWTMDYRAMRGLTLLFHWHAHVIVDLLINRLCLVSEEAPSY